MLVHPVTQAQVSEVLREVWEMKSPFVLRAHFAVRSFHALNIALSRNTYGLFPLNCIKRAF